MRTEDFDILIRSLYAQPPSAAILAVLHYADRLYDYESSAGMGARGGRLHNQVRKEPKITAFAVPPRPDPPGELPKVIHSVQAVSLHGQE
jgi:hypothetical protein